jgi:DNA-binding protein H-NS
MHQLSLEEMDFDELMLLHDQLTKILSERRIAEKRELEDRLARLGQTNTGAKPPPKYRNPLSLENVVR